MELNAKIYLAGHRGLAGSALLACLQKKGYSNIVVRSSKELDLTNQQATLDFFYKERPEYVIVSAGKVGGILANNTYSADFLYVNLMIATNTIYAAYKIGVKKLLYFGSSCIYPKFAPQPIQEESLLTGSLEPTNEAYALAKIAGLKMCEFYHRQYGCDFLAAMPCNLYGYKDNYDLQKSHVLPAFIRKMHLAKALQNNHFQDIRKDFACRPVPSFTAHSSDTELENILKQFGITKKNNHVSVTLWGTGNAYREFLHADDMAKGALFLLNTPTKYRLINIGSGTDHTISEIAQIVKNTVGFQGSIEWDHTKPDGTPRKLMNNERIYNMGFRPDISLSQGIQTVYSDYLTYQV